MIQTDLTVSQLKDEVATWVRQRIDSTQIADEAPAKMILCGLGEGYVLPKAIEHVLFNGCWFAPSAGDKLPRSFPSCWQTGERIVLPRNAWMIVQPTRPASGTPRLIVVTWQTMP